MAFRDDKSDKLKMNSIMYYFVDVHACGIGSTMVRFVKHTAIECGVFPWSFAYR